MQNRILVLALALIAPPLSAQAPAPIANAGSAAQARPPALTYQSVFADYRAWHEPAPMDWRAANREAGALGGHMGQIRGGARTKAPMDEAPVQPQRGAAAERSK